MDRKKYRYLRREMIGLILLLLLLAAGLLSSHVLAQEQEQLARQLENASWWAMGQDWDRAVTAAGDARTLWQQHPHRMFFYDQSPITQIDQQFARLTVFSAQKNRDEFAAACAALAQDLKAMADAQRLSWKNLL